MFSAHTQRSPLKPNGKCALLQRKNTLTSIRSPTPPHTCSLFFQGDLLENRSLIAAFTPMCLKALYRGSTVARSPTRENAPFKQATQAPTRKTHVATRASFSSSKFIPHSVQMSFVCLAWTLPFSPQVCR